MEIVSVKCHKYCQSLLKLKAKHNFFFLTGQQVMIIVNIELHGLKLCFRPDVVAHTFNPSPQGRGRWISYEFKTIVVYTTSSRRTKITQ